MRQVTEDTDIYEDENCCSYVQESRLNKYGPTDHHGVSDEDRHSCTAIIMECNKFKATNQD